MPPDTEFDDAVLFDVPAEYHDSLLARLAPGHPSWLQPTDDGVLVLVVLRKEAGDLARLLRNAEAWLAESGLLYLRYNLDGREYVLRAKTEAGASWAG
jgi:hypothetical protein